MSGDVPYSGDVVNDYEVYKTETKAWRDEGLHVFPSLGNHEFHGDPRQALEHWWDAFPQIRNLRWYSVALGKAVYTISQAWLGTCSASERTCSSMNNSMSGNRASNVMLQPFRVGQHSPRDVRQQSTLRWRIRVLSMLLDARKIHMKEAIKSTRTIASAHDKGRGGMSFRT